MTELNKFNPNVAENNSSLRSSLLLLGIARAEVWWKPGSMASEAWFEDGWWWKEDHRGNLFWRDGKRWRRFEKPGAWQAAKESAADTAQMAFLSALIAYAGVKKVKNMF